MHSATLLLQFCLVTLLCRGTAAQDRKCEALSQPGSNLPGKIVASVKDTSGLGVFFLEAVGTAAQHPHYPCQTMTGLSCQASSDMITVAIGAILADLTRSKEQVESAVPALLPPEKRDDAWKSRIEGFLKHIGATYDHVYSGLHSRRDDLAPSRMLTIHGLKVSGSHVNLEIEGYRNSTGRIILKSPTADLSRRGDPATYAEPAEPGVHYGAGIKITFTTYPENLQTQSVARNDAYELARGMANDWALGAEQGDKINYLGIFQQRCLAIAAIMIIPETAGFGLNWEDPNAPCGDLVQYACPKPSPGMYPAGTSPASVTTTSQHMELQTSAKPRAPGPVASDTAICNADSHGRAAGKALKWSVQIGRPIIDRQGCTPVYQTLCKSATISSWTCDDDGYGQTLLTFESGPEWSNAMLIISGLAESYPSVVGFKKGICTCETP